MANRAIVTGRLTADPELRQTPSGVPVTSFSIAVPRKFSKEKETDFLDIVAWRTQAEFVCTYFSKGKWVEVDGRIQTRTYEDKNKNKRKAFEIVADEINFVGDKPKEGASGAVSSLPEPPPPPQVDPFGGGGMNLPPAGEDFDEDGDLPF